MTRASRGRSRRSAVDPADICGAVAAVVERVFETVQLVRAATVGALEGDPEAMVEPATMADRIDAVVRELLLEPAQPAIGLGVVFDPDQLEATSGHQAVNRSEYAASQQLRWWQLDPTAGSLQLLTPDLRPSSLGYYDYLAADWFDVPRRTGRRHVVGPYIDLNGTGQYLLTLTGPVTIGDRFVGVVGADVPVRRLETHLMTAGGALSHPYVLVNEEGRVVLSTSPRWLVGALADVRHGESEPLRMGRAVAGVPWTLYPIGSESFG